MTHTINGVIHRELPYDAFDCKATEVIGLPPMKNGNEVKIEKARSRVTQEEKTDIAKLYQEGNSINKVAETFGRSHTTIHRVLDGEGVELRKKVNHGRQISKQVQYVDQSN